MEYRKNLHERFLLPQDRAIFRKVLSVFSPQSYGPHHLINPHVGLNEPDVDGGGVVALVHGKYAYHHYMQVRVLPWLVSSGSSYSLFLFAVKGTLIYNAKLSVFDLPTYLA